MVELKGLNHRRRTDHKLGFNRSMVELKVRVRADVEVECSGFNRSMVELKEIRDLT